MNLKLSTKLAKIEIAANTPEVVPFIVSVEGVKPVGAPSAYLIAIDTSFSMNGAKIFRAKEATLRVLENLKPSDLVSIYGFNAKVEKVKSLVPASRGDELAKAVIDLKLGGGTNIYEVLRVLERDAAEAIRKGLASSVKILLITDGNPTTGPRSFEAITRAAASLGKLVSTALVVGIGEDYNEKLLAEIARNLNGVFEHVENPDQLTELLPRFVVERRELSAKNVKIFIKPVPGVEINIFGRKAYLTREGVEVDIGDVHYGERIDVAGEILLSPQSEGARVVASIRCVYQDPSSNREEVLTDSIKIVAVPQHALTRVVVNERVLAEVNAVKLAEALSRSMGSNVSEQELLRRVEEILNTTLTLGSEDLYRKTIDLQQTLRERGLSPTVYKELMSILSRILSGKVR